MHNTDDYFDIVGSDVGRDGMFFEVVHSKTNRTILEVFYSDENGQFSVSLFEKSVPLGLLEWAIGEAKHRLPPSE